MTRNLQIRLSTMMFIQYCALGTVVPILGLYFKQNLHYSGNRVGLILAISAVSSIVSPLVSAFIADRVISSARVLVLCNIVAGASLLLLSFQKTFFAVIILFTIYSLFIGPVSSLSSAITFHNSIDAKKHFTRIRVWGTAGWIAAGWIFALIWNDADGSVISLLPEALRFGAFTSFVMAVYAFFLPRHRIHMPRKVTFIPVDSFRVFARKEVLYLGIFTFLIAFVDKFHYFATAPFLSQSGFSDRSIMPLMSTGQIVEIFVIVVTGFLLKKYGFKTVMAAGILSEFMRFGCYAIGSPDAWIYGGLAIHGFTYGFFFMSASIYIDSHCSSAARTGVHQIFSLLTGGLSGITGNLACGWLLDFFTDRAANMVHYHQFWIVPTALALIVFLSMLKFFPAKANV
jgi:nucleoside transporter